MSQKSRRRDDNDRSTTPPDLEILGDQVTLLPSGYIEPPEDGEREQALMESHARFRKAPLEFLREVSLHVSGKGWRAYDNPIGQPIFYSGFSENMKTAVLAAPILQQRIAELADKRIKVEVESGLLNRSDRLFASKRANRRTAIEHSLIEVCDKLTDEMICKMESKRFIRSAYYLCTELLTRAYHQGIHVSSEEVVRLREVALKAEKSRHSIVFLPCHRSHVDYVSLQLICYRLGLALPTVVAGDNLNIPVLGAFLQHAGAMWIRRSFGDDILYTTLVQSYIDTLLQGGFNFECFVEGGRSRTGKLLPPKFGILSYILDSILSGRVDDAIICPVSTQYDKVIETEGYVGELLGVPKKKENLADFLSSSSVLSLKLGRVDVRFHEPWSLRQFVQEQQSRNTSVPANINMKASNDPAVRLRILRTLGYKVLSDINAVSVVMPTALIGTVLLTLRGRGVGKAELIRRVEWLSTRVLAKGGRVAHFARAATSAVVDRGLEVLGKDLVGLVEGLPEPTYYAVDRFQLSFYRNMTIHLFVSEALVCASMYMRVKQGGDHLNQRISYSDLKDQVLFLSQLFRGEFIYSTEGLAANFEKTLNGLESDAIIELDRDSESGKIVSVGLSSMERAVGRENYDFYCFLIWPFVEASWLGAVSLMGLTPRPSSRQGGIWVEVTAAQNYAQLLGKTLYHQGDLSYFEAVNKETLKNAYERFAEEGIIIVSSGKARRQPPSSASSSSSSSSQTATTLNSSPLSQEAITPQLSPKTPVIPTHSSPSSTQPPPSKSSRPNAPQMRLAPAWTPRRNATTGQIESSGRLWDFIERIASSRREGKNRRDGATVSTRVLGLADRLGASLVGGLESGNEKGVERVATDRARL